MFAAKSIVILASLMLVPTLAVAQPTGRPAPVIEITGGQAGFVDDSTINHAVIGGALRFHLLPGLSVGPEVQYMIGPGHDRDLLLTGNLTIDILPPARRVTPFFVVGGGLFRHSDEFNGRTFSSNEGALTAGGGVRGWLNRRVYAAGELRLGWELHYRVSGTIGFALGS